MPEIKADIEWLLQNVRTLLGLHTGAAVAGPTSFDYFLTDTASDLGGYYRMQDNETGEAESSFLEAGLDVGNHLIDSWSTPIGEPGANALLAGLYDSHFHAERTAGNRTLQFYWELYTRTHPGGVETLRMTSDLSSAVTSSTGIVIHAAIPADIEVDPTDRLVYKLYAAVSGVGANVNLAVYAEGANDSHVTVPVTTSILSNIFIRRDGTVDLTDDWAIAAKDITLTAGTLTARVLAAGDVSNLGTLHLFDGSNHKLIVQPQAMSADVTFKFPPNIDAGKYLKSVVGGANIWDDPAGGGVSDTLGYIHVDENFDDLTPGAVHGQGAYNRCTAWASTTPANTSVDVAGDELDFQRDADSGNPYSVLTLTGDNGLAAGGFIKFDIMGDNLPGSAVTDLFIMEISDGGANTIWVYIRASSSDFRYVRAGAASSSLVAFATSTWYSVEVRWTGGSPSLMYISIDDTFEGRFDMTVAGHQITEIKFGFDGNGAGDPANDFYIDNLQIWDPLRQSI